MEPTSVSRKIHRETFDFVMNATALVACHFPQSRRTSEPANSSIHASDNAYRSPLVFDVVNHAATHDRVREPLLLPRVTIWNATPRRRCGQIHSRGKKRGLDRRKFTKKSAGQGLESARGGWSYSYNGHLGASIVATVSTSTRLLGWFS